MTLYIKFHPSFIAYYINDNHYGLTPVNNDLFKTLDDLSSLLKNISRQMKINHIVIEKPFLRLMGESQKKVAKDIIHVQRHFGAILFSLKLIFPTSWIEHVSAKEVRESIYGNSHLTKDIQITEVSAIIPSIRDKDYPAIGLLCMHDCLCLKTYIKFRD